MNRFKIVDGLPYLFAAGRHYACRWDDNGFTVGVEVSLTAASDWLYSEREIFAKCSRLDSIGADQAQEQPAPDLDEMTAAELKKYAAAAGIEIKARATKAEIIAAIRAAE